MQSDERLPHHDRILQEALDRLSAGIILLSKSGKVLFMNAAAGCVVDGGDGLKRERGFLSAEQSQEASELRRLVDEITRTSSGNAHPGGSMKISRSDGSPLFVSVAPLGRVSYAKAEDAVVIVFITDPEHQIRASQSTLEELFRITPAEYRVACLLTDGLSTAQIADALSIRSETLKSQLASLYHKTGTSGQSQLVRLMLLFPSQLAAKPG